MRIAEICSHQVACIDAGASIRMAATEMRRHHAGCMVIIDPRDIERIPRGILTDRDIVVEVIAAGIDPDSVTVREVMAHPPATCREDDKLRCDCYHAFAWRAPPAGRRCARPTRRLGQCGRYLLRPGNVPPGIVASGSAGGREGNREAILSNQDDRARMRPPAWTRA